MSPKELILAPSAIRDLDAIFFFLAQQDVGAATRTVERLNAKIFWIAQTGFSGVARDRLAEGLRLLLVGNYGVYYRLNDTQVIVLRVLRGGRNITPETFEDL